MRMWKLLSVAVAALSLSTMALVGQRGVRLTASAPASEPLAPFDSDQSAALFVGVRQFSESTVEPIRYTVDDAIALAYAFSLERRASLVRPERVVLALAGDPEKKVSRERRDRLKAAGATIVTATQHNIARFLELQAHRAGKGGVLIVFLASHGFTVEGTPYVLTSTSRLQQRDTLLSAAHVLDVVSRSAAQRSLILIDACRERLPGKRGAVVFAATTTAPFIRQMKNVAGEVLFYAARPGGFSYEDPEYGHGVFTQAILEGLACRAAMPRGFVTVETLATFVEKRVLAWIREHRDKRATQATQVSMDPDTSLMPLASCAKAPSPVRVASESETLVAFGADDVELWRANVAGSVVQTAVVDLDMDDVNEVVASFDDGRIAVFDPMGSALWTIDTHAPVQTFLVDHLYGRQWGRHIVATSHGETGSRLTVIDKDGTELVSYSYPGVLRHVVIDRVTAYHDQKIIVSDATRVFALKAPRRGEALGLTATLGDGSQVWQGALVPAGQRLDRLQIIDHDNDRKRDIALHTATGDIVYLDFDGRVLRQTGRAHFQLMK